MLDKTLTATEVRNKWFEVLTWVNAERKNIIITKNKLPIAKISPARRVRLKGDVEELIKRTYGMLKDKKGYFPYEDPKVIAREKKHMRSLKKWKVK